MIPAEPRLFNGFSRPGGPPARTLPTEAHESVDETGPGKRLVAKDAHGGGVVAVEASGLEQAPLLVHQRGENGGVRVDAREQRVVGERSGAEFLPAVAQAFPESGEGADHAVEQGTGKRRPGLCVVGEEG